MGSCHIDHSLDDVIKKFEAQKEFLPDEIIAKFENIFHKEHDQQFLNELFHLLKKYDLADETERKERNGKFLQLLKNI